MKWSILILVPLLSGCLVVAAAMIGAAVAVGTYAYVEGEGSQDYAADVATAHQAILDVCKDTNLGVAGTGIDAWSAWVDATSADGTLIRFRLERLDSGTVHLGIRVGTFGDEAWTLDLHRRIAKKLEEKGKPQG